MCIGQVTAAWGTLHGALSPQVHQGAVEPLALGGQNADGLQWQLDGLLTTRMGTCHLAASEPWLARSWADSQSRWVQPGMTEDWAGSLPVLPTRTVHDVPAQQYLKLSTRVTVALSKEPPFPLPVNRPMSSRGEAASLRSPSVTLFLRPSRRRAGSC